MSECLGLSSQQCSSGDEYSDDMQVLERVISRVQEFADKVDETETRETEEQTNR